MRVNPEVDADGVGSSVELKEAQPPARVGDPRDLGDPRDQPLLRAQAALATVARSLLGRMDLKQAQRALRESMSREALARCDGSRRAAAVMLGVDRRYVQRLLAQSTGTSDDEGDPQ